MSYVYDTASWVVNGIYKLGKHVVGFKDTTPQQTTSSSVESKNDKIVDTTIVEERDDVDELASGEDVELKDTLDISPPIDPHAEERELAKERLDELSKGIKKLQEWTCTTICQPLSELETKIESLVKAEKFEDPSKLFEEAKLLLETTETDCQKSKLASEQNILLAKKAITSIGDHPKKSEPRLGELQRKLTAAEQLVSEGNWLAARDLSAELKGESEAELFRLIYDDRGGYSEAIRVVREEFLALQSTIHPKDVAWLNDEFDKCKDLYLDDKHPEAMKGVQQLDARLKEIQRQLNSKEDYEKTSTNLSRIINEQCKRIDKEKFAGPLEQLSKAKACAEEFKFASALVELTGVEQRIEQVIDQFKQEEILSKVQGCKYENALLLVAKQGGSKALEQLELELGDWSNLDLACGVIEHQQQLIKKDFERQRKSVKGSGMEKKAQIKTLDKEEKEKLDKLTESSSTDTIQIAKQFALCKGALTQEEFRCLWCGLEKDVVVELIKLIGGSGLKEAIQTAKKPDLLCKFIESFGSPTDYRSLIAVPLAKGSIGAIVSSGFHLDRLVELKELLGINKLCLVVEHGLRTGECFYTYEDLFKRLAVDDLEWLLQQTGTAHFYNATVVFGEKKGKASQIRELLSHAGNQPVVSFDAASIVDWMRTSSVDKIKNMLIATVDMKRTSKLIGDLLGGNVEGPGAFFNLVRLESVLGEDPKRAKVYVFQRNGYYKGGEGHGTDPRTGFLRVEIDGAVVCDIHIHWFNGSPNAHVINSMHICDIGGSKSGFECQKMTQFAQVNKAVIAAMQSGDGMTLTV